MKLKLLTYLDDDPHVEHLLSWVPSQKILRQWAGPTLFTWPLDKQQLITYLARAEDQKPVAYIFKVVDENNIHVGHFEFDQLDQTNKIATLSRVLVSPNNRGAGLGEQMLKMGLKFIFNRLKFKEIKLNVYSFNTPAIQCYKKLGFKPTGIIEDLHKTTNENWDCCTMSISAE